MTLPVDHQDYDYTGTVDGGVFTRSASDTDDMNQPHSLSLTHTLIHTPFFSALSVCYISAESNSSRKQAVTSNEVVWINAAFPLTFYIVTSVCVKTIERYTLHYSSHPSESLCSALEAQRKQN